VLRGPGRRRQNPAYTAWSKASTTFTARRDKLLQKLLTPPQHDRWIEIEWQKKADEEGPSVLLEKGVVEYLSLSDAQQRQIQTIAAETKQQVETEEKNRHFVEAMKKPAANLPKALAVLKPHQKQQWGDLLGKPYRDQRSQLIHSVSPPAEKPN
jgi:hypothetical protein